MLSLARKLVLNLACRPGRFLYGLPGPPCPAALTAVRTLIQATVLLGSAAAQGAGSGTDRPQPGGTAAAHARGKVGACTPALLTTDIGGLCFDSPTIQVLSSSHVQHRQPQAHKTCPSRSCTAAVPASSPG